MNGLDLRKVVRKEHEGKWIAISPDSKKLFGYSSDLLQLRKDVKQKDAIYLKVPLGDRHYAFTD